jgi:hypothetical protein
MNLIAYGVRDKNVPDLKKNILNYLVESYELWVDSFNNRE